MKQDEEINQQSQELADVRKNYASETEKVREKNENFFDFDM